MSRICTFIWDGMSQDGREDSQLVTCLLNVPPCLFLWSLTRLKNISLEGKTVAGSGWSRGGLSTTTDSFAYVVSSDYDFAPFHGWKLWWNDDSVLQQKAGNRTKMMMLMTMMIIIILYNQVFTHHIQNTNRQGCFVWWVAVPWRKQCRENLKDELGISPVSLSSFSLPLSWT